MLLRFRCQIYLVNSVLFGARKIATKLKIDDRVQKFHEAEAFITVKDHKDNFPKLFNI